MSTLSSGVVNLGCIRRIILLIFVTRLINEEFTVKTHFRVTFKE